MVDLYVFYSKISQIVLNNSVSLKWLASIFYVFATIILISPDVAAQSVVPFSLYLMGNIIWAVDSFFHKQYPWFWTGVFFVLYDALLVYSRATREDAIVWVRPFVEQLNRYLI